MDDGWDRLARAIYERRTALGLSRQRLADLAGVSLGSVKNLEEKGRGYERTPPTMLPITEALGWTRESASKVLAGGEPTLTAEAARREIEAVADRYEIEDSPDATGEVGTIVRDTVFEVVGVLAPDTPLSQVREIEARALEAVLRRGKRPLRRHPQAYQETAEINDSGD